MKSIKYTYSHNTFHQLLKYVNDKLKSNNIIYQAVEYSDPQWSRKMYTPILYSLNLEN